jgi:hypothetical protein
MATHSDTVTDRSGYRRPIPGVSVYVLQQDGALADAAPNPVLTDAFGSFTVVAPDGVYVLDYRVAGVSYFKETVTIGDPPQYVGPPGPADNTYTSLTALLASDITRKKANLVGDTDTPPAPDGPFNVVGGVWVRQNAAGIQHQRAGTPAILDVAKSLDALGIHPLMWGWDGLPTSDATPYIQGAVNYCNTGTQAASASETPKAAYAKSLILPYRARVTAPIVIPNRASDRTAARFEINGMGGAGVLVQEGNFAIFTSSTPDFVGSPEVSTTEKVRFADVRFTNLDPHNTGSTLSDQFFRVTFIGCGWQQLACLDGARLAQEWTFIDTECVALPAGRPFLKSRGAYLVSAYRAKFQFSYEGAPGAFLLRHPTALQAVAMCGFTQCSYESSFGPFLAAGQVEAATVDQLYCEGNNGPLLDFRCVDNGSTNYGVRVLGSALQANSANAANTAFGNVLVGPGGLTAQGNASRGGLYDNSSSVTTVGDINLRQGHSFGQLVSVGDRMTSTGRKYQANIESQIDLIPDPASLYASKVFASTVVAYPVNGVPAHTIALPPPVAGARVMMLNRLTGSTQSFTALPSYSADGSKFRGGAANGGLIHEPGVSKTYLCLEDGIWDVAT